MNQDLAIALQPGQQSEILSPEKEKTNKQKRETYKLFIAFIPHSILSCSCASEAKVLSKVSICSGLEAVIVMILSLSFSTLPFK